MEKSEIKAKEIYEKFYLVNKDSLDVLKIKSKAIAKTNALVCVDEIIKELHFSDTDYNLIERIDFYQEVKQHLNNL